MPSGSKKRKSSKKKKKNGSSNHVPVASSASTHTDGGDVVEHQLDKESDVGDVSSHASQDHHRNPSVSSDGEEEIGERESISNPSSVKGLQVEVIEEPNTVVEEENLVPSGREFKVDNGNGKRDGRHDHYETAGKSYDGGSSGSSNSSSDDESHGIMISQAAEDTAPIVDYVKKDYVSGTPAEAIPSVRIEEAGDAVVEDVRIVDLERDEVANHSVAPYLNESVIKENWEKSMTSVENKHSNSPALIDAASEWKEDGAVIQYVDNIAEIRDTYVFETVIKESGEKMLDSVEDKVDISSSFTDAASERKEDEAIIQPVENIAAVRGPYTFESVIKEDEDVTLSSVEDRVGISLSLTDAASEQKEEEVIIQSVENVDTIPDPCVFESEIKENGEKTLSSIEDGFGISLSLTHAASERKEKGAIIQSAENIAIIQDPCVFQSEIKENEEKLLSSFEDKVGIPLTMDAASKELEAMEAILRSIEEEKRLTSVEVEVGISPASVDVPIEKKEEEIVQFVGDVASVQDQTEYVARESDDQLNWLCNTPITSCDNVADSEKNGGITEPLLAPAPRPVQKPFWKSCCGLFEVFTGSGR